MTQSRSPAVISFRSVDYCWGALFFLMLVHPSLIYVPKQSYFRRLSQIEVFVLFVELLLRKSSNFSCVIAQETQCSWGSVRLTRGMYGNPFPNFIYTYLSPTWLAHDGDFGTIYLPVTKTLETASTSEGIAPPPVPFSLASVQAKHIPYGKLL